MAFARPPPLVLKILQKVQIILAGFFPSIQVDNKGDPKSSEWGTCVRMVNLAGFKNACRDIWEVIGQEGVVDRHIGQIG